MANLPNNKKVLPQTLQALKAFSNVNFGRRVGGSGVFTLKRHEIKKLNLKKIKYSFGNTSLESKNGDYFIDNDVLDGDFAYIEDKLLSKIYKDKQEMLFWFRTASYEIADRKITFYGNIEKDIPKNLIYILILQTGGMDKDELLQGIAANLESNLYQAIDEKTDTVSDYVLTWIEKYKERIHEDYNDIVDSLLLLGKLSTNGN